MDSCQVPKRILIVQTDQKGFQIWTALREEGFSAENAPYYAVMRFDPSEQVPYDQPIDLHKRQYTEVARIQPISDFIGLK